MKLTNKDFIVLVALGWIAGFAVGALIAASVT